jgi:predicted dehydrogenase
MNRRRFLVSAAAAALTAPLATAAAGPRLRAAQIGTRHSHASGKMEAMRRLSEDYEVIGIAEPDPARRALAERQPAYAGLPWMEEEAILADETVRVVAVETELEKATATALRCIEAGKHVHLDKPGGTNPAAFAAMRRRAEERGLVVQMGYMLRYNPAFELLFRAARERWLGEILEVNASMGKLAPPSLRAELASIPGHGMFELACHLVDAVVTLLGRPEKVTAFASASRSPADALPDNQLAVLAFPRGSAVIRCNHADPGGSGRRRFEAVGTEGSMEIAPLESGRVRLSLTRACGDFGKGEHALTLPLGRGRYDGEFLDLARCIRGEKTFAWSAAHDIAVLETALLAAGVGTP